MTKEELIDFLAKLTDYKNAYKGSAFESELIYELIEEVLNKIKECN